MSDWSKEPLGDLAEKLDSKRVPLSKMEREQRPGSYPYYGATGVMDYIDDFLFEGLHLLVAEDGSVESDDGRPVLQLVNGRFWVNNHAHVLKAVSDTETRFLYYALSTVPIRPFMSGSVQAKLSQRNLNRIPVPYPPASDREAIVATLGALDDKIELNRRMNETLEGIARAIFKSWFVDFDPVRAKMEGRQPYGMSAETAALFPDSLVESELGLIPEGWDVRSLDEVARFVNGLALQKYPPEDGRSLPVIKIAQLRAGNSIGADLASADLDPDYVVEDGDVLFSWSGSLECVLWAGGRGALNQHLFKVTSPADYPKWFYYFCVHHHLDEFRQIAAGKATTMGHIQRHHLSDAKVATPPLPYLLAMNSVIEPFVETTWRLSLQSRTLASLRDAVLPKLISGEIRVGEAPIRPRALPLNPVDY